MYKLIKLKETELYAVEFDTEGTELRGSHKERNYEVLSFYGERDAIALPENTYWEILGTITEEGIDFDVTPFVKRGGMGTFKDYTYVETDKLDKAGIFNALLLMKFETKEESFYSLLTASGISLNYIKVLIIKKV